MAILIGSKAIKIHFPDFPREPKDLDYAVKDEQQAGELSKLLGHGDIRKEFLVNPVLFKYTYDGILSPDLLLTLKMSHLFWDINWDRHMHDVQFLLKKGAKLNEKAFYDLYEYWNEVHGKNKRSDLKMSAADFFDNALKEFDHDHLHTLINPTPTYINMLAEDAEVEIDEQKFQNASDKDKENLIREEVMVMAFERFRSLPYKRAYLKMFKKYLISHAPLYVAIFAIQNYIELMKAEYNFIEILNNKI